MRPVGKEREVAIGVLIGCAQFDRDELFGDEYKDPDYAGNTPYGVAHTKMEDFVSGMVDEQHSWLEEVNSCTIGDIATDALAKANGDFLCAAALLLWPDNREVEPS